MTTTDDLAALLAAATPGPWSWETESGEWPDLGTLIGGDGESVLWWDFDLGMSFNAPEDARLLARAPTLAAEVLDLRAKLAEAEGALAKVSGALNDAFAAGAEEREGGSWRRQGMLSERYEAVRAESKDALAAIREGRE